MAEDHSHSHSHSHAEASRNRLAGALAVTAGVMIAEIVGAFTGAKTKSARQAELEQSWAAFAKEKYAAARLKVEEALKLAK